MKEELVGIERYRATKERLLIQAASNLEAMQTTRSGLESELHQVLIFIYILLLLYSLFILLIHCMIFLFIK